MLPWDDPLEGEGGGGGGGGTPPVGGGGSGVDPPLGRGLAQTFVGQFYLTWW